QFKKAFEKKDFDSFSRLFCWGKADEAMKTMIKQAFESELDQRIANVSILEVPAGLKTSYERNGIQYRTTLPPIAKLQITFEKKKDEAVNAMSFLVGKKGSEYYLLTAEPVSP
nr:hypothetical protein [Cyanobacteria bacterium UBA8530]